MPSPKTTPEHLTAEDILALVRDHLPAWMRACEASDSDAIALHESEFGTTTMELLLFACAIKFAATNGKNVYVACGRIGNEGSGELVEGGRFVAVYREEPHTKPQKAVSKPKRKSRMRDQAA
ncbi:MAG TPA: hypothetical protein VGJ81_05420 [Thermoanaerobaculia bacterium]|jgi:hypothetical protein